MKIIISAIFIVVMISVGIYSNKKVKNTDDFLLGGRKMGPWISAVAYGTSYFSAVIFIGYAGGLGWKFGISTIWIGIGNAIVGSFLAWKVLGNRTREITKRIDAKTMPEFFEKRYKSKLMKIISAVIIFIFLVPYTASVYKGLGFLFVKVFGDLVPNPDTAYLICVIFMAVLTGIYLFLGGYVATAMNDLIQGCVMIVGVIVMVILVVNSQQVGGLANGISQIENIQAGLGTPFSANPLDLLGLVFLTSVGVWGLPQMIHKYYAVKDESSIKKGAIISTAFAGIIGIGAYLSGVFGRLFMSEIPDGIADKIVPEMLDIALPDFLMGIIMVLVLSASMSTLASLVLVSSSAISNDLIKGFIKPNMNNNEEMGLMRLFCVVFVGFSFYVAISSPEAIVNLMALSWGALAGCFLGPYVLGIWWKGSTKIGAFTGMASGLLFMVIGVYVFKGATPNVGSLAMITSVLVTYLVSLVTPKVSKEDLKEIF